MSGKILYVLIAALILAGAGFYLYDARQQAVVAPSSQTNPNGVSAVTDATTKGSPSSSGASSSENSSNTNAQDNMQAAADKKPADSGTNGALRYSNESDIDGNDVMVEQVIFDGSAFSPSSLTIKAGDIVVFKNQGTADIHPYSDSYAGLDSGDPVSPGQIFQFKLIKSGKWSYYDKLNPKAKGTITVTK